MKRATESPRLGSRLDDAELEELERFLSSPRLVDTAMSLNSVDGYFAAILSGPRTIMPSESVPSVWDPEDRKRSPEFESLEQANRILGLLMRRYNTVARTLMNTEEAYVPIYAEGDTNAAASWCTGYLAGVALDAGAWKELVFSKPTWFAPIFGLGASDEEDGALSSEQVQSWSCEIGRSTAKIHAYWLQERRARQQGTISDRLVPRSESEVRRSPRVGRNEPCPCGSGRKFKRCCGASNPV